MDISVITINYNNNKLTGDFINSVIKSTPKELFIEFIVIDNCSKIDDFEALKYTLQNIESKIKLVRSNINLGFGGGNMLGNQYATGKYLAFINNDIIFTEDCFSALINFIKTTNSVGVCTPQQYNIKKKPTSGFDYFHGIKKELLGRSFVELFRNKDLPKRKDFPYQKSIKADFIQGCFMFFTTEAFSKVGGFDTNIFLYFEEMDICYRLKKCGFDSYVVPNTSFLHFHGASTSKNMLIRQELLISKLYIYKKNYSFLKYKILQFIIAFKLFFKSLINFKFFQLFLVGFTGGNLKYSLKHKQSIIYPE